MTDTKALTTDPNSNIGGTSEAHSTPEGRSSHNGHRIVLTSPDLTMLQGAEVADYFGWSQIRRMTELLQTDSGALTLFQENPLLAERYANASYFINFVRSWRQRVPVLPESPELSAEGNSTWDISENFTNQAVAITFHHSAPKDAITIMTIRWDNQQISSLSFMRGYGNTLPLPREHRRDR